MNKCVFQFDKDLSCGIAPVIGSDFCPIHINTAQNACMAIMQTKTVLGWDPKKKVDTKNKVIIHCNKMRQAGSTLCPHHALIEREDNRMKAAEMKMGGYGK